MPGRFVRVAIRMIIYDQENRIKYRIDSDALNIHQVLEKIYLEALHEAREIFCELMKERGRVN